jgi:hypothetical protein
MKVLSVTILLLSVLSGTSLRLGSPEKEVIHTDVIVGTDTYYALPSVREALITRIRKRGANLQKAVYESVTTNKTTNISRAILVNFPPDNEMFSKQLKWLYLSIGEMRNSEPSNIKTDLLIFTHPSHVAKLRSDFSCEEDVRSSFSDPEACHVFPHLPLHLRDIPPKNLDYLLMNYSGVGDSILVMSEFAYGDRYDYLLRTDLDTFVTPGFGPFVLPANVSMAVGSGGYHSRNAALRLKWVATQKLGLDYHQYENVGSTWYGRSRVMIAAARLSMAVMEWLTSQEFTEFESLLLSGTEGWPYWYKPVMTMYSGDIAINQIPASHLLRSGPDTKVRLDFGTATANTGLDSTIQHLHAYQVQEQFSKLQFDAGNYRNLTLEPFVPMNTTASYSMMLAVSSDRMNVSELVRYVGNQTAMRKHEWFRLNPNSL